MDWSRLFTVASGQRTPSIPSLEADQCFQDRPVSECGIDLVNGYPRRLPPRPVATPHSSEDFPEELLPSYATAIESPPAEHLPSGVTSSPVTTLVDLESEEDIEYIDEVLDTPPEPVPIVPSLDFATTEGTGIPGAMDQREIVRITTSTETFSQDITEIVPPPTSNQNDEDVRPDHSLLSIRPSISLAILPPPQVLATPENTFDSPDATSFSTSSSPSSSSLVRCLTGLVRRGTEPACARGGYSDVWKGKLKSRSDLDEEEDVAIKVLRAVRVQSDGCPISRMHKRMTRETSIWVRLVHPNVVPLRGYSLDEDGTPAIVSRWMDNGDVLTYLARHHFADRRKLVRQVAEGLLYLHSQNPPVVHGDLKGGNVLIDKEGDAALCDFGMSTFLMDCQPITSTSNAAVGTVRWCAPGELSMTGPAHPNWPANDLMTIEILDSDNPLRTLATDIWAFASLSLEILTGRLPFYNCTNDVKVVQKVVQGERPAREDYPELPADNRFWEVLESCWKKTPEERPTMGQLRPLICEKKNNLPETCKLTAFSLPTVDDEMFSALTP